MAVVGTSPLWAGVAQMTVLLLLIPVVFMLGTLLSSRRVGLVAAGLCSIEPLVAHHASALLTEGLTALLLTALALVLLLAIRSGRRKYGWWLLAGMLAGSATIVRPANLYFGVLLTGAVAVWCGFRIRRFAPAVLSTGLLALPQVLIVGIWKVRNSRLFDSTRLSPIESINMYLYRGGAVVARRDGLSFGEAQERLGAELPAESSFQSQGAFFDDMYARGVDILVSHPVDSAIIAAEGVLSAMVGPGREPLSLLLGDTLSRPAIALYLLAIALMWLLVVVYLWFALRNEAKRAPALWVASIPAYVLLISAGPEAYGRFRAPVIPILLVLATAGAAELLHWWRNRTRYNAP